MNVSLKESGAKFVFNFAEVYWNSRLQMEHARLIQSIQDTSLTNTPTNPNNYGNEVTSLVVADMMAGVGPFAVPLAMSRGHHPNLPKNLPPIQVHANGTLTYHIHVKNHHYAYLYNQCFSVCIDLNPASFRYLLQNRKLNHLENNGLLSVYNMDGRDFILELLYKKKQCFHEVIMNLPQSAEMFLDVFIGLYRHTLEPTPAAGDNGDGGQVMSGTLFSRPPRIHLYAFSKNVEDPIRDVRDRAAAVLQCCAADLTPDSTATDATLTSASRSKEQGLSWQGHIVRDVSPKKVMVYLSFVLPVSVVNAKPAIFMEESSVIGVKRALEESHT